MENNDQTNYELGVLNEELNRTSKLIHNFAEENLELQKAVDFDPKDPKSWYFYLLNIIIIFSISLNILNKMKFINTELKSFKEKISSMFELVAVFPNFSKNPILDENKALEKCYLTSNLFCFIYIL